MILSTGNDLVEIKRIALAIDHFGERFLNRCFSAKERDWAEKTPGKEGRAAVYAKRWAAKEAVAKALGLGIAEGVYLRDIQVVRQPSGQPVVELAAGAKERLRKITPAGMTAVIHLSLSDDAGMALAFVVIDAISGNSQE